MRHILEMFGWRRFFILCSA